MIGPNPKTFLPFGCLFGACFIFPVVSARCQVLQEETLSGPDSHETGQGPGGHLFGEWGGRQVRAIGTRCPIRFPVRE